MGIYAPSDTGRVGVTTRELPDMVTLANGACVTLRPAREHDIARLERMYYRCSAQSIYYRLFVGAPHVAHWASRFAAMSTNITNASVSFVAVVGEEVVGTARFDCDEPSELDSCAEVGIIVEDAWQGHGLGKHLLRRLAREAVERRITTFTARILAENQRAIHLFKGTFAGTRAMFEQGEYAFVAPLLPLPPELTYQPIAAS